MPMASNAKARCSGSSGSSIGWVVNHQFSRRYSDGGLRSRVISASPNARQASSIVHESDAAQAMPVSTATTCSSGISSNSPEQIIDSICPAIVVPSSACMSR